MRSARSVDRRGFTLFELLIVVLLIGIIYGIFVHKLTRTGKMEIKKGATLRNLPQSLDATHPETVSELVCIEPCERCFVYRDGKQIQQIDVDWFDESPVVYEKDKFGQFKEKHFLPLLGKNDELLDTCFRYRRYNNKSGSEYIVQVANNYYVFDAYMYPVRVYEAFEDAASAVDDEALLPTMKNHYDF